ncbi:hypothetical protein HNY73_017582 [Argiope bruennichi]|uniref:Uncharacterized protein n=1 Tax=Argiope bruennichi TaxID=94029 RepID=A0A8T0EAH1_ARGBR|nr:hypothetical protein HNY73_017582 [Argiope bruennichi]
MDKICIPRWPLESAKKFILFERVFRHMKMGFFLKSPDGHRRDMMTEEAWSRRDDESGTAEMTESLEKSCKTEMTKRDSKSGTTELTERDSTFSNCARWKLWNHRNSRMR